MKRLLAGCLTLAILGGCGPETKPIRGEWFMADSITPVTLQFHEDGTYQATWKGNEKKVTQYGVYSQNGTWLNMYAKRVETHDPQLTKAFGEARLEPQRMRTKWLSKDRVVLDSGKGKREITRVSQ